MHYLGGKHRQSKKIVEHLLRAHTSETVYVEPMCGSMSVAEKALPALAEVGVDTFRLSDVSLPLVNFWKAVVYAGWEPPDVTSEDTYRRVMGVRDSKDPMTAWCGFCLSFHGKWFRGYARSRTPGGRNTESLQLAQKRAVLRKAAVLREYGAKISCRSYETLRLRSCLVYLDPPYEGRTKGQNSISFHYEGFWEWAEKLSVGNTVLVTEMKVRRGWRVVHNWGDTIVHPRVNDKWESVGVEVLMVREGVTV